MKRKLILYWYVPKTGWHPLYDLHLANLTFYANRFDETDLVISRDRDTQEQYIQNTVNKLQAVLPNTRVSYWLNDPAKREGDFFYKEVIGKLSTFDKDTTCFFAHNKGAYSSYMTKEGIETWINFMYFANLYKIDQIETCLDSPETITIGTFTVKGKPKGWDYLKYNWHYSGTFFWFVPSRLLEHLEQTNQLKSLPPNGRYFAESLFGSIIQYNSGKDIHLYGELPNCLQCAPFVSKRIPEEDRQLFYETVASLTNHEQI